MDPGSDNDDIPEMVKGLDRELLRKEREKLRLSQAESGELVNKSDPAPHVEEESEMAKEIRKVLFDSTLPHPHMIGYESKLEALVRSSSIPCVRNRCNFVYSSDPGVTMPIVVLENDDKSRRNFIRDNTSPAMISAIADAFQKKKKKKKVDEVVERTEACEPVTVDDDMFGGLHMSVPPEIRPVIEGPLFDQPIQEPGMEMDVDAIRFRIAETSHLREQAKIAAQKSHEKKLNISGDDDFGQTSANFGEKLDIEKFGSVEDEERKRKPKTNHDDKDVIKKVRGRN